ncbi:MAG: hypothetical protein AAF594_06820 [Bacteroidota bacterium]
MTMPLRLSVPFSTCIRPSLEKFVLIETSPSPVRRITPVAVLVRASAVLLVKMNPTPLAWFIPRFSEPLLTRRPEPPQNPEPSHKMMPSLTSVRPALSSKLGGPSAMWPVAPVARVTVPVPRNVSASTPRLDQRRRLTIVRSKSPPTALLPVISSSPTVVSSVRVAVTGLPGTTAVTTAMSVAAGTPFGDQLVGSVQSP